MDLVQQRLGGDPAHLCQRLVDGGEARDAVRGRIDVVKADDGDIPGYVEVEILKGADGSDGGVIVERHQRRERMPEARRCWTTG